VLSCRVMLDVPLQLASFLAELLAAHRREIGTRRGTRALTCWKQAVFALAWFRGRPDIRRPGRGFGISQATAYRYLDEAIAVLAARAPGLREAREQGLPYLILDGKVAADGRCKEKTISKKGREIDRWYSGKAHGFGGNVQALFTPAASRCGSLASCPAGFMTSPPPRARPGDLAAFPEGPAGPGRLRVRRHRLRRSCPGEEPRGRPGA
jgi:hypothetical protein